MASNSVSAYMSPSSDDRKPRNSAFYQQNLRHVLAHLSPLRIVLIYAAVVATTIPIGVCILHASHSVTELSTRYDGFPCLNASLPDVLLGTVRPHFASNCYSTFSITVSTDMIGPVYVYYQLSNYYQNHRRYVENRSYQQIRGEFPYTDTTCDPLSEYNDSRLLPCGLTANSFFNDTFAVEYCSAAVSGCRFLDPHTEFVKSGIAYPVDNGQIFAAFTPDYPFVNWGPQGFQLPATSDEDLMVWMRVAALPCFYKLHRIIPMNLYRGDVLNIHVNNVYSVASFNSEKRIVIANASWMGGRNFFLGWAYIALGCFCSAACSIYLFKRAVRPRKLGDLSYFAQKPTSSLRIQPQTILIAQHVEAPSPQQPFPLHPYRPHKDGRPVVIRVRMSP